MKKINIENKITEKELKIILSDLEIRWKRAASLKDTRKRFREIMRIKNETRDLLEASRRAQISTNSKDNSDGSVFLKIKKTIIGWLSFMDKKYK